MDRAISTDSRSVSGANGSVGFDEIVRLAVEACPSGMIMTDADGQIVLVNAEAQRLFGYERDELLGNSIDMLVPAAMKAAHGGHRANFIDRPETRRMGVGRDLYGLRKDGTEIPVEIGLNPIHTPEGTMVLSAIVDISERNRAMQSLAEQREELQRSNADLEQFAYVASHDLQEPLRMVATYAQLFAERYQGKLDERADKYIQYTIDGAKRMQQLIKELLEYSRVSSNAKVPIKVESALIVENAILALKAAIDESGAEIVRHELPAVRADQAQLAQVFQNIIGNAIKFHSDRRPVIRIGAERRNGKCEFHVEDNGIGIDKQYADRIFQMFQRLHERGQYEGNGIGLAIVKKIVERHGGRVWFESEPGRGTTFYFTITSA
jgi:PAS domain S-box-containing protein